MTHLDGEQSTSSEVFPYSASTSGLLSMPRSSQTHMPHALFRLQPFNQPVRKEFVPLTRHSRGGGGMRGGGRCRVVLIITTLLLQDLRLQ